MPFHVGEYIDQRQADLEVWRGFCVIGPQTLDRAGTGVPENRDRQSLREWQAPAIGAALGDEKSISDDMPNVAQAGRSCLQGLCGVPCVARL